MCKVKCQIQTLNQVAIAQEEQCQYAFHASSDAQVWVIEIQPCIFLVKLKKLKGVQQDNRKNGPTPGAAASSPGELQSGLTFYEERYNDYSSPKNDTWVYKVTADSSCRKNSYQLDRHAAATHSCAPGNVRDQHIQLQHTPARPSKETSPDPLICTGKGLGK